MNQFNMSPSGNGYFFFFCCFIKWDKSPSSQNSIIIISCPSSMKFSSYPTMWGCFSVFKSSDLFYFYRNKRVNITSSMACFYSFSSMLSIIIFLATKTSTFWPFLQILWTRVAEPIYLMLWNCKRGIYQSSLGLWFRFLCIFTYMTWIM